ncbi:MAG: FAD-binding oxidoreductase [Candidatus Saccharimonadales bacterium]
MSKVSAYLNEHLQGEVTTNSYVRKQYSTDGSVLSIIPDMVAYPRSTSDLRKIARFSWQLSEKGHALSITPRGNGTDQTGGAIGNGVVVDLAVHMNAIFEVDAKQRLVRLQPGVTVRTLSEALRLQGLYVPALIGLPNDTTIGGAIANNSAGSISGKYGAIGSAVSQLEVILSNGEVLQTGRVSKKLVERKKGLQTFEGEIYRSVDNLINDNDELLDTLAVDVRDNVGYNLVDTKRRDGSIDLTPLIVGSQGTLGTISEIILKAEPLPSQPLVVAIAFPSYDSARDGLDALRGLYPSLLDLMDGRLFVDAATQGKRYKFHTDALDHGEVSAVVVAEFDDASSHVKKKTAKKIAKMFSDESVYVILERDPDKIADLQTLPSVVQFVQVSEKSEMCAPPFLNGAYIPQDRFEDFAIALLALEQKHHIDLPLSGHASQHVYYTYPLLNFHKVSDRQTLFKLLAEWSMAVSAHGGHLIGEDGEGRLKALFAYKDLDDDVVDLFASVRSIFDPQGIMNTGVKQSVELKKLATELNSDYDSGDSAWRVN